MFTNLTKEQNRELCERYPFLIPSNRWSGKRITDAADGGYWPGDPKAVPEFDYEYTELDQMPDGWRIAFGEELCAELKAELEKTGRMDDYRITQIKEKFGMLRLYDNWNTEHGYEIIRKYVEMSKRICICCGKPATRITLGWISPYCDDCLSGTGAYKEDSVSIEEYFAEVADEEEN